MKNYIFLLYISICKSPPYVFCTSFVEGDTSYSLFTGEEYRSISYLEGVSHGNKEKRCGLNGQVGMLINWSTAQEKARCEDAKNNMTHASYLNGGW